MIKLENVSKFYVINKKKTAIVEDINLTVEKKDIFGLVGPTGSGKSTLLRIMTGFITPDTGAITLNETALTLKNRQKLIKHTSMIFQSFNLLSNKTVLDNIALPLKLRKIKKRERLERAREVLGFVGLSDFADAYSSTLSGGQKQRVAIARALITHPEIIFCDEPTSALDEKTTYEILSLLKKINSEFNTTIVLVSHDISVIKSMCNKIAILDNGKINHIIERTPDIISAVSYLEALE